MALEYDEEEIGELEEQGETIRGFADVAGAPRWQGGVVAMPESCWEGMRFSMHACSGVCTVMHWLCESRRGSIPPKDSTF